MALKRPGAYTPLAANYADDEAIMQAGEDAELMYVRILAYCGRTPKTEGWISDQQIRTRLGIETRPDVVPETRPDTAPEKRAERLADVGLLTRERDGYRVTSWLKWNASREEMQRKRTQDGNRHSPHEQGKDPKRDPIRDPIPAPTRVPVRHGSTETETETETVSTGNSLVPLAAPTAQTLIGEWIDHCGAPPAGRVIGQAAKEVKALLDEGIAYDRVRQGLADWAAKGQHPATIPSFVSAVGNRRATSTRQQETDDLFSRAAERMGVVQ